MAHSSEQLVEEEEVRLPVPVTLLEMSDWVGVES